MGTESIAGAAKVLASQILDVLKTKVGEEWDTFKEKDKKAVERAAKRFAQLSFNKLKGDDVERDLAHIEATLANYAYVESSRLHRAFWESAGEVVGVAASFLQTTIAKQLPNA